MPRNNRCILPGAPYHVTQRGIDRRETFSSDSDRATYLKLLYHLVAEAGVRLLGWCLMPNHVHLIAIPNSEESLAILLRRLQGRYAQYYNASTGRLGHLWQNRYFSCALGPSHLIRALMYVDLNPVRAGLVRTAEEYRWSSASAHLRGADASGLLDTVGWDGLDVQGIWPVALAGGEENFAHYDELRRCTHSGRPFGSREFVTSMQAQFGRRWNRTPRPPLKSASSGA